MADAINPTPLVSSSSSLDEFASLCPPLADPVLDDYRDYLFSELRSIRDPEHPSLTLEQLRILDKSYIFVESDRRLRVLFKPTVPHCSLTKLIGLCLRAKLSSLFPQAKIDLFVVPGSHLSESDINKQLNDKERTIAALENAPLRETVERLIKQREE